MDLKQKLLDNIAAEAEAKRQAIEAEAQRIAHTERLCELLNAASAGAGFTPVITVCGLNFSKPTTPPRIICTVRAYGLGLDHTLQTIKAAELQALETVPTYPEEPNAPWKFERSISVDGFPGIEVMCTLSKKEQQAALCA